MKFLPTKVHGVLDYLVGVALLLAPTIFGFSNVGGAAVWVPRVLGIGLILYSLLTAYELGVVHLFSMKVHLIVDAIAAVFLALSPFIFNFKTGHDANVWMPHIVVGIAVILVVLVSKTEPGNGAKAAAY